MNKGALVAEVSRRTTQSKAEVARVINSAMDVIRESVARGERVALTGFGTFEKRRRNRRLARNPRKPDVTVTVPARDVPSFAPGHRFRQAVLAKGRRATRSAKARAGGARRAQSRG